MDDRPVVWDAANRKHLGEDHPEREISLGEVEEVLNDGDRVEVYVPARAAYQVVGRTTLGRWLVVVRIHQREGRYPVHARIASNRIVRRMIE